QIGAGILTFAYWKSKSGPSFKVCGRKPPGYPNALDCGWYMAPKTFQGQQWIVFVAQVSDRNSLVAIDDIQYRASIG
uniref:Cubilin n=1 Tax=Romanomermis culicivorax TaxID=13658 RepID=A0A915J522_ROMCU